MCRFLLAIGYNVCLINSCSFERIIHFLGYNDGSTDLESERSFKHRPPSSPLGVFNVVLHNAVLSGNKVLVILNKFSTHMTYH